jgi:hypothetical protein
MDVARAPRWHPHSLVATVSALHSTAASIMRHPYMHAAPMGTPRGQLAALHASAAACIPNAAVLHPTAGARQCTLSQAFIAPQPLAASTLPRTGPDRLCACRPRRGVVPARPLSPPAWRTCMQRVAHWVC